MDITSIELYPTRSSDRVLTYASVVFDDEFVVHNIRLIDTDEKLIVAMPNEEHDGGFRDIAHPINQDCRLKIRERLLEEYEEEVEPLDENRSSESAESEEVSGEESEETPGDDEDEAVSVEVGAQEDDIQAEDTEGESDEEESSGGFFS